MASTIAATGRPPSGAMRVLRFILHEFVEIIPPTLFFAAGFNLVVFSMNLILAQYYLQLTSFVVATVAALVVGKAVLVADAMPFLRRFDTSPLIYPILFKTVVYWAFVCVARLIEAYIHYVIDSSRMFGFSAQLIERFSWHRFAFIQIWILVLFLVYCTASELNALFGNGELARVLFRSRSTELKLNRRQRVRALVQISRITEAHSLEELRDPGSAAHRKFFAIVTALAQKRTGAA
jgi:hypothetical protein